MQTEYKFKYQNPLGMLLIAVMVAAGIIAVLLIVDFVSEYSLVAGIAAGFLIGVVWLAFVSKINDKLCVYEGTGILADEFIEIKFKFTQKRLPLRKISGVRWLKAFKRASAQLIIDAGFGGCYIRLAGSDGNLSDNKTSSLYRFYLAAKEHYDKYKSGVSPG